MNWFERYEIPGLHFVGLVVGWTYAFCPQIFQGEYFTVLLAVIAVLIAVSLPAGYIISICGQFVYLNWRRCLWRCPRLRGWLGFHGAATDMLRIPVSELRREERDEAVIEARTLLLSATIHGPLNVEAHSYIRNWIARRMDVVALNSSLIVATLFLGMVALVVSIIRPSQPDTTATIVLSVISTVVIITMVLSIWVLRKQVIEVIAGIYRTYS